ncbi:hypothetical protein HU715_013635 [Pseudomonas sp. SWRI12]|uniref:Uncharacterized protein n=1 Tax=Pseudomonas zanjanensis TaxID=2745496 RepID=A0A923FGE2_9PSED|nr:hypothetical protein [Pseudomonas zanjanensis]MBV4496408.1 hypothetical protein [Pseudomonas zanjanensis]
MNIIDAIWPIPGPIAAALVAGLVSFVVTVLAKDQKTSEFRQAWIDGLRADVADFVGLARAMLAVVNAKTTRKEDASSYVIERHDDFTKIYSLITRIRLRLNPDEHGEMLELLNTFFTETPAISPAEMSDAVKGVVSCSQKILKSEWKRVKRGEPAFLWLKRVSLVFILAAVIGGFALAVQTSKGLTSENKPPAPPASVATPKIQPSAPSSSG